MEKTFGSVFCYFFGFVKRIKDGTFACFEKLKNYRCLYAGVAGKSGCFGHFLLYNTCVCGQYQICNRSERSQSPAV